MARQPPFELDPGGLSPKEPGAKLDAGKPRAGLVLLGFAEALAEVIEVGTYGANKYSPDGWQKVPDGEARYTDAMLRHLLAEQHSEIDEETGLMHSAQVAWNALARLHFQIKRARGSNG